jgi:hypothetical protein
MEATITLPASTGQAIELLQRFWQDGTPLPLQSFTTVVPYPASSVGGS